MRESFRAVGAETRASEPRTIRSGVDWIALAIWSIAVAAARMPTTVPMSWRYFDQAAAFTFGGLRFHNRVVGLHLYHVRPADQFGPLAVVAAQMLRELGGSHVVMLAHVVLLAAGLGVLWLVADAADHVASRSFLSRRAFLVAGGIFLFEWDHLALQSLHIDDAIAVVCVAVAIDAVARRSSWWWAAIAIGAATAAKPWAITFLPLLAVVPYGRRRIAFAVAVFLGLAVWAPFVLADSKTLLAAHYTIPIDSSSVLRLFGVGARRTPRWDRLTQLVAALALGIAAVRRHRWQGVVLVAVALRIMLDPSARSYYTTGFVFAALVWDLLQPRWRWPLTTICVASLLELPPALGATPTQAAILRLIASAGAIAVVFALPSRDKTEARPTGAQTFLRRRLRATAQ
jgi:hypothetical protein